MYMYLVSLSDVNVFVPSICYFELLGRREALCMRAYYVVVALTTNLTVS